MLPVKRAALGRCRCGLEVPLIEWTHAVLDGYYSFRYLRQEASAHLVQFLQLITAKYQGEKHHILGDKPRMNILK